MRMGMKRMGLGQGRRRRHPWFPETTMASGQKKERAGCIWASEKQKLHQSDLGCPDHSAPRVKWEARPGLPTECDAQSPASLPHLWWQREGRGHWRGLRSLYSAGADGFGLPWGLLSCSTWT